MRPGILEAIDLLKHLPGKARDQPVENRTKEVQGTTSSFHENCSHQKAVVAVSVSSLEGEYFAFHGHVQV